jgi:glycosyltransferase involved in cell wall biosynthesis
MRFDHQETGNEYLVIRKAPSKEAPFKINDEKGINIENGDDLSVNDLISISNNFNPNMLYISGWNDKRYLAVAKHLKKIGIPTITGLDNQWLGSLKQHLASWLSLFMIKPYFSHVWVAGIPQYYFAKKLGFKKTNIVRGLYCADDNLFKTIHQNKRNNQFLFIGRMVENKGLRQLFKVLNELIKEKALNFNIHFVGNGPLENQIPSHDFIKHTPFVNPKDLPCLMVNAGYFLLPSLYEAWGVVVHEAALAGMPIITTHQTGAASDFVIHNYNGFLYNALDTKALKNLLITCSNQSDAAYLKMAQRSKQLAKKINLPEWSAKINTLFNG